MGDAPPLGQYGTFHPPMMPVPGDESGDCKIDVGEKELSPKEQGDVALCRQVFDVFDADHTGFIDKNGFKLLINYPDLQSNQKDRLTDADIETMLRQIDTSKDGQVSFDEFFKWWQNPGMSAEAWAAEGRARAPSQFRVIQRNLQSEEFLQNVKRFGTKETYYCALCFEYQLREVGVVLSACHHSFCRQCMTDYLKSMVLDGKVNPTCFHDQKKGGLCSVPIAEADILSLVDEPTQMKYKRFKLNQMDGNHRTCSKCEHTQIGKPQPPEIVCEKCGHKYCFAHGDAHGPDVDCTTHERNNAEEERKTKAIISQKCKLCPKCSSPILKSGGCNHMKCPHCRCSFCWLCLQEVEDIPLPSHYKLDPANPGNTCIGRQMEGMHRADALMGNVQGWRRCVLSTFYIVLTLVILLLVCPISFVLTLASVGVCFLCIGRSARRRMLAVNATFCASFWALIREWFSLWSHIACMALSCILCLPCVLWALVVGGCWPSNEEQEDDFEAAEIVNNRSASMATSSTASTSTSTSTTSATSATTTTTSASTTSTTTMTTTSTNTTTATESSSTTTTSSPVSASPASPVSNDIV